MVSRRQKLYDVFFNCLSFVYYYGIRRQYKYLLEAF